ncbi:MAG: asparagine synthetase [Verrucomicrobiales bacterium]|nr:asparagine synthetase [Verrucomicrobiales bacterium]
MCGIAAIFNFKSELPGVDREELIRIRDRMQSRGPDASGAWFSPDNRVGLGHRRLSIIDLSEQGCQPMHSLDGTHVIVFNGEIYNYLELREDLENSGFKFRSTSDTEVLLNLFARDGAAMLTKLEGMFAFGIWNTAKKQLFLARDPYGIKPLYYSVQNGVFRMASQVKAIRAGNLQTSIQPAGHAGFFLWGSVPDPFTLYKEISALPAGHYAVVDSSGLGEIRPYLKIDDILRQIPPAFQQAQPSLSHLRNALEGSVRKHLVADVPVGLFLSSGLDSTTLTALASRLHPGIQTVTLGFEEYKGTENDEVPLAELVARHYGTTHRTIWITKVDFTHHYDDLMKAMDQPSTDGVNTFFVSQAARVAGLKVALSGLGGDELFGGYPSFHQIPEMVRKIGVFNALPSLGRGVRLLSSPLLRKFTSPKYAGLLEYGGSSAGAYLLRRGMFMPWELPEVLGPDLAREGWDALNSMAQLQSTVEGQPNDRCLVSALESTWYMKNQLLRDSDWASMAHSLEVRVPLVDVGLLNALYPALQGIAPFTKRDMGRCLLNSLPLEILNRPKTGFTIPVRDWLTADRPNSRVERGLRGWTRHIYDSFLKS